jgi:hypothetical protein
MNNPAAERQPVAGRQPVAEERQFVARRTARKKWQLQQNDSLQDGNNKL